VILDFRLQIENPQRTWWGEAQEWYSCRHVYEPADQEVALADLRRATQDQQATGCQHARCNDVLGHRAGVIEQFPQPEGRHGGGDRCPGIKPQKRWPVLFHMQVPDAFSLAPKPLHRPVRAQHGGVVTADAFPARVL